MVIPELTKEQRIESFIETRLGDCKEEIRFSKKELAEFCLQEIDNAIEMVKSTDVKDVEEQVGE